MQGITTKIFHDHPYPPAFATVGGSHAFGYATELSDCDVHGVHILPLKQVIGLYGGSEVIERKVTEGEHEIEISTYDLKKFILLLVKGNGNILEDLYSPLIVHTSPLHEDLKILGKGCITKMCSSHYRGMAFNQQRRMQLNDVKKLLHVYRCLLMGMHLMASGTLELNIAALAEEYHQDQVLDVILWKQSGMEGLDQKEMDQHSKIIEALQVSLVTETEKCSLPERTSIETRQALENLLINARMGSV